MSIDIDLHPVRNTFQQPGSWGGNAGTRLTGGYTHQMLYDQQRQESPLANPDHVRRHLRTDHGITGRSNPVAAHAQAHMTQLMEQGHTFNAGGISHDIDAGTSTFSNTVNLAGGGHWVGLGRGKGWKYVGGVENPSAALPSHADLLNARREARAKYPAGHPERLKAERAVRASRKTDEYRSGAPAKPKTEETDTGTAAKAAKKDTGFYTPQETSYRRTINSAERAVYDHARKRQGLSHEEAVKKVVKYRGANPRFRTEEERKAERQARPQGNIAYAQQQRDRREGQVPADQMHLPEGAAVRKVGDKYKGTNAQGTSSTFDTAAEAERYAWGTETARNVTTDQQRRRISAQTSPIAGPTSAQFADAGAVIRGTRLPQEQQLQLRGAYTTHRGKGASHLVAIRRIQTQAEKMKQKLAG